MSKKSHHTENYFIEELKKTTENKLKFKINNLGGCILLSDIILETIDESINYNTLRRLYDIIPNVKTRTKSLDILSKFNGYNNFAHFIKTYSFRERLKYRNKIYKFISNPNEKDLSTIIYEIRNFSDDFIDLIIFFSRELIYNNYYQHLDELFNLKEMRFDSFSYNEVLDLGNSIGIIFRKKKIIDNNIFKNQNFNKIVYSIFVDYSNLNNYYGNWIKTVKKCSIPEDVLIFSNAVLEFKNYLNRKPVTDSFKNLAFDVKIHPVLKSRILSVKVLANNYDSIDELLQHYIEVNTKKNKIPIDYFFELMVTSLVTNNKKLMKIIYEYFEGKHQILNEYQLFYLHIYYLMSAIYLKSIHKNKASKQYYRKFDFDEIRYSYEDIIKLICLVYDYHNSKTDDKSAIKKRYTFLNKNLKYSRFDAQFLESYFD